MPCIVDVIVRGLVAGVGTQQMPLVGHAEIDNASRLHGHAGDRASGGQDARHEQDQQNRSRYQKPPFGGMSLSCHAEQM